LPDAVQAASRRTAPLEPGQSAVEFDNDLEDYFVETDPFDR